MTKKRSEFKSLESVKQKGKLAVTGKWYDVIAESRYYYTLNGQKITAPKICVATDYSKIEYHDRNRKVYGGHVKRMGESIVNLSHVMRCGVVVEHKGKYYVADAQHMFKWLISQNMPIEFYLISVQTEQQVTDIMREMNSSSKKWGINQFVKVGMSNDKKNPYVKLDTLVEEYKDSVGMTIKVMAALMFNESFYKENQASRAIYNNYFVQNVPDVRLLKKLNSLKRFYKKTKMSLSNYLNAGIIELMYDKRDLYFQNEKRFLESVKKYVYRHKLVSITWGNKKDVNTLLDKAWQTM
jgi:hypothetical protein